MKNLQTLSRRKFLLRTAAFGCSAAASPFLTPITLAAAPWDNRLVVIILRGAMDGLDVIRPYGDRNFAAYRPSLSDREGTTDLDGFFALNMHANPLMPLWKSGELAFANAVATPYRDKRSHFDGQDMLEAGTGTDVGLHQVRDGWMNRMLAEVPGITAKTAFAVDGDDAGLTTRPDLSAFVRTGAPDAVTANARPDPAGAQAQARPATPADRLPWRCASRRRPVRPMPTAVPRLTGRGARPNHERTDLPLR